MAEYLDFDIYKIKSASEVYTSKTCDPSQLKCILLTDHDDTDTMVFLKKIMSSVKLSLENECNILIPDKNGNVDFEDIFRHGHARHIISFGFNKSIFQTQAKLKPREWNHFESFSLLLFDGLRDINASPDLKRKLWDQIKMLKSD